MEALRHLRLALGTGFIFYGFDLRADPERRLLYLSPGLAFDGAGQSVALESTLPLPLPDEGGPLWLCLRHVLLVDERDEANQPLRERDSVEVLWLPAPPRDDEAIPLARVQRGPGGWQVDGSFARRAPSLAHRHTGETGQDRSGRLRYEGDPPRALAGAAEPPDEAQARRFEQLITAVEAEFAKLDSRVGALDEQQTMLRMELEELRVEAAEAAERGGRSASGEGWQEALAALREDLYLTVGEEVREEIEQLRAAVLALSARPAGVGADLGGFTPVQALHGVGEKSAQRLREMGVETVSDLLAATATPEGRQRLESTRLTATQLRRWSHEADLLRLYGVGPKEVQLLDTVGITSSAQLATEAAADLFDRLREAARLRSDIAPPPAEWVASWIEQARHLPPVVEW